MLSDTAATALTVTAGFRAEPHYIGSIHDDESAREYGYKGALVPGIILYGYLADLVVQSWGLDWVARGTMWSRSRRPVYEGDQLRLMASAVQDGPQGQTVDLEIRDPDDNLIVTGGATLPSSGYPIPDRADFPVLPFESPLRSIEAGGFQPGDRFGCAPTVITPEELAESREMFSVKWPLYAAEGIIHPAYYPRLATRHALSSYSLPTPSIYVCAKTYHLGIARVGAELTTSGVVTAAYERKGNHYTDQRHLVLADGQPIALVDRTSIYAVRKEH